MPLRIENGYVVPVANDKGQSLYATLDAFFRRIVGHNHDGVSGNKVKYTDLEIAINTFADSSWSGVRSNGYYELEVNIPPGFVLGVGRPTCILPSGEIVLLDFESIVGSSSRVKVLSSERIDFTIVWG